MKTTETPTSARRRSPIFWVPTAYFGMGLPFVVLNMVAVLMYKGLGVSDAKIAFWTSLIMLPWTLKPLWSPLLEMYRTKKFFVVLTQMVSGVDVYKRQGEVNTKQVSASEYYGALQAEDFIYDASFIKLKELSIGYSFPSSILKLSLIHI